MNNIFKGLNYEILDELKLREDLVLYFIFRAKDIKCESKETLDFTSHNSDLKFKRNKENLKEFLKYIDNDRLTFSKEDSEFLSMETGMVFKPMGDDYVAESLEDLYKFVNYVGLTDKEINTMKHLVYSSNYKITEHIITYIKELLEYDSDNMVPTQGYMEIQAMIEFNANIIFSENIGKAIEDFSFRERMLVNLYTGRKFQIEIMRAEHNKKIAEEARDK